MVETTRPWGPSGPVVRFGDDVLGGDRAIVGRLLAACAPSVFADEEVTVACLPGGANNRNYTAAGGGRKVVVRVANELSERFAVDRASATQAQRDAAAADLAPQVIAAELPAGHTISEFLVGETLRDETIRDDDVIRAVGAALRRLHSTSSSCRDFSPFVEIRLWTDWARRDGTELPSDFDQMLELCDRVERVGFELELPPAFCHNDTVPQNFIRDSTGAVRLVDWDFAANGWASFDVASFINIARLDDRRRELFIDAYSGGAGDGQMAMLELLGFVAAVREVAWGVMATPVLSGSTTLMEGWSYESFCATNLAEARARLDAPGFEGLFAIAASERGRAW
ncbi:MAG: phosphotransferase [Actinobacteria bacterium]|nr:phosphotransferase [Actinomycetota bacterium]